MILICCVNASKASRVHYLQRKETYF